MAKSLQAILFLCIHASIFLTSSAQTSCASYSFPSNQVFTSCNDLPVLNSFLHWNYNETTGALDIAYRHTQITPTKWVAWGINPTSEGMIGAQAIVAYQQSNGAMRAYTTQVKSYDTMLQESSLSINVLNRSASFVGDEITIFVTLEVPGKKTVVNQVWQEGPLLGSGPGQHDGARANVDAKGSLDLLLGQARRGGGDSKTKRRNVHGVLNAVSWGILMPIGVMIARYMKVFKSADPAWFYLHVSCQFSAYIIGVAGWLTGLKLGSDSPGIQQNAHRNIGILLFVLATLQVFALLLRPKKDHKYRFYWNIYHHSVGYTVILLSIINIFKGFDILNPDKKWKKGYIGFISILICCLVLLEAFTWFIVLKRKKLEGAPKMPN